MAAGALAEVVTEEVASNLEEVAQATRALDTRALGFFTGGMFVGGAIGFYFGYRFNKEKLRLEAFNESQEEVEAIRETYRRKELVLDKPELEQIIEERGYSVGVERPLPAPVPVLDLEALRARPEEPPVIETPTAIVQAGKNKDTGWNYKTELSNRTPNAPYIIHQDEHQQSEHGYEQVEYIYWDGDGVLTDSDNQPLLDSRGIVGPENLKWGHGSDDANVVYVRNDTLELEMSITRDPRSWEEQEGNLDAEDALRHSSQSRPAPRRSRRTI